MTFLPPSGYLNFLHGVRYPTEQVASVPMWFRWPEKWTSNTTIERGSTLDNVVEIRDIFPTLLEYANIDRPGGLDGTSMYKLIFDPDAEWRTIIDMELALCDFNYTMNWNALTDGKMKYVYYMFDGREQLFNISQDPYELHDMALKAINDDLVISWRHRLIEHYTDEGRGELWLHNGTLTTHSLCYETDYTPNYPCWIDPAKTKSCTND